MKISFLQGVVFLLSLFFLSPCIAQEAVEEKVFETDFYRVAVPPGWSAARTRTGLWEFGDGEGDFSTTVLVSRLTTTPALYLQATGRLWQSRGRVEAVGEPGEFGENRAFFLIIPRKESEEPVIKGLVWQDDLLAVTSSTFPVKHRKKATQLAVSFTRNLELKEIDLESGRLETFVTETLDHHSNTVESLSDAPAVRREMASFRQDWEPYFPHHKPALYQAMQAYLEARYDAAFVIANGEEMGMPPSLVETRLRSIRNRRAELERALAAGEESEL
jgi:hypothetical protein